MIAATSASISRTQRRSDPRRAERGRGYPAFFRAPGFCVACFSTASFAGAPPAIGNNISRWSDAPFAARLPLGAGVDFAAAVAAAAGGVCLAAVFGASSFALSMLCRNAAIKSVPATILGIGRCLATGIPAFFSFSMVTTASS